MIDIKYDTSLRWNVDYDYDDDMSNCSCPDYCRCGVIVNERVTGISPSQARGLVIDFVKGDELEQLLAFMFFRHCLKSDDFNITTCSGYYGEEIGDIKLSDRGQSQIGHFNTLIEAKDVRAALAMILTHHYGYVLPDLLDYKEWELVEVSPKNIYAPKAGMGQVTNVGYDYWSDKDYPSFYPGCIVIPCCDDKLKIVDGFHRWTQFTSKKKRRKVKVLAPVVDKNNG